MHYTVLLPLFFAPAFAFPNPVDQSNHPISFSPSHQHSATTNPNAAHTLEARWKGEFDPAQPPDMPNIAAPDNAPVTITMCQSADLPGKYNQCYEAPVTLGTCKNVDDIFGFQANLGWGTFAINAQFKCILYSTPDCTPLDDRPPTLNWVYYPGFPRQIAAEYVGDGWLQLTYEELYREYRIESYHCVSLFA